MKNIAISRKTDSHFEKIGYMIVELSLEIVLVSRIFKDIQGNLIVADLNDNDFIFILNTNEIVEKYFKNN